MDREGNGATVSRITVSVSCASLLILEQSLANDVRRQ